MKQRKRKYVVDFSKLDSDENVIHTADKSELSLDMRITTHGKISNYVNHINKTFNESPQTVIYLYAEGAAVPKLISVIEIVKRSHALCEELQVHSELSIGDTIRTPRSHLSAKPVEQSERPKAGLYASTAKPTSAPAPTSETEEPPAPSSKPKEMVWIQAKLTVSS